jgi:hypothetical protein
MSGIEALLLTAARISTFDGQLLLTNASSSSATGACFSLPAGT